MNKTKQKQSTMKDALIELERLYDHFNQELYDSELPAVQIAVNSYPRQRNANGWFWPNRWTTNESEVLHELTLCSDRFVDGVECICSTLLHEMVHVHNYIHGIEDCKGRYHNKNFKRAAESIGFEVSSLGPHGWTVTVPGKELLEIIKKAKPSKDAFSVFTERQKIKKKGSTLKRIVCPSCHTNLRVGMSEDTFPGVNCIPCNVPYIFVE